MQNFRAFRYGSVVIAAILCNFLVFNALLACEVSVYLANIIAFVAGGQLSFLLHDIHTYGDKHPTMDGWVKRWVLFVGGNLSSLGLNSLAITVILTFETPEKLAHVLALAMSGTYSVLWNHFVSHKDPPESDPVVSVEH
ncbi:MAG: GtrA family protein [Candidatus Saccharimonadales bacterium]